MYYVWIIITGLAALGIGIAAGICLDVYRKKKQELGKRIEFEQKEKMHKSQLLINAFFELKENISFLENISELIKEEQTDRIAGQLEQIKADDALQLSKTRSLDKQEFELIDNLHSIIIAVRKIDFYNTLYGKGKISLLEFRANVDNFIDQAQQTREKIIEGYEKIFQ